MKLNGLKKAKTSFYQLQTELDFTINSYLCNYLQCLDCKKEDYVFDVINILQVSLNEKSFLQKFNNFLQPSPSPSKIEKYIESQQNLTVDGFIKI